MIRPLVVAHRGASGYRPEHTESAYRLAARLGADMLEPDVVATRDGVLVLRHEHELSGTTDVAEHADLADRRTTKEVDGRVVTGWFAEDLTWEEVSRLRARERLPRLRQASSTFDRRDRILRLEDLLRILDETGLGLVAELKHATHLASIGLPLDELVADALREHGWADRGDRVVVESFEHDVLHRTRARGVAGRYVGLLEHEGAPADEVARLGDAATTFAELRTDAGLASIAASGLDGVGVSRRSLLDETDGGAVANDLVARAHAAGLAVLCWTLRPESRFLAPAHRAADDAAWGDWMAEWGVVLDAGVDGVFVDHPDLAVALLDARDAGAERSRSRARSAGEDVGGAP